MNVNGEDQALESGDPRAQLVEAKRLRALALRLEIVAVRGALRACGGNVRQTADLLDMPKSSLDHLLSSRGRLFELAGECSRRRGRPEASK